MPTTDELYTQTINEQRAYLANLQETFNKTCDEITAQAKQKLAEVPEENLEERKKIFEEQKNKLEEALNNLRRDITVSGNKTRRKLEELHAQREANSIDALEKQILTI